MRWQWPLDGRSAADTTLEVDAKVPTIMIMVDDAQLRSIYGFVLEWERRARVHSVRPCSTRCSLEAAVNNTNVPLSA